MVHSLVRRSFAPGLLFAGLWLAAPLLGCGQAKESDLSPGTVRGTLRMRIANFDDHAETRYRLVTKDETIELSFAEKAPHAAPGAEVIVGGAREGSKIHVDHLEVVRDEGER